MQRPALFEITFERIRKGEVHEQSAAFLAVAIIGAFSAIGAGAASALPVDKAPATTASSVSSDVQQVRWHHRHWHHRRAEAAKTRASTFG
jgi:hypothetical protein